MRLITIAVILALFVSCNGKEKSQKDLANGILIYADSLANALMQKDYRSFVKFMYPKTLEYEGGEEAAIELISKLLKEAFESKGGRLISINFGNPSTVIQTKTELQATVAETITAKVNGGKLLVRGTMIAISADGGEVWRFIETSGRDINAMKNLYPNLSAQLVVPKTEDPVFIKE